MASESFKTRQIPLGPGKWRVAPVGTTEPAGLDDAWPSAWATVGWTKEGSNLKIAQTIEDVEVAEEVEAPLQVLTKRVTEVEMMLAERHATQFQRVLNGGTITSLGTGYSFTPPQLEDGLRYLAWGWEADAPVGEDPSARLILRRCVSVGDVEHPLKKGTDYGTLSTTLRTARPEDDDDHWILYSLYE